jgi:hypothetical protein
MKSSTPIVDGGGWLSRKTVGRPRTRFVGRLAVIWLLVSAYASFPFWGGWPESFGWMEWLCGAVLLTEPVLVTLAIVLFVIERPRALIEQQANPDCDIRKMY